MSVQGKKVVLMVSGGIAAYKAADLASRLRKAGAEVRVAMTRAATKFVAPLTFEAIAGHPVYRAVFDEPESYRMEHIEWARWADAAIVAPATAHFIAAMAHGLADDAPLTFYLAFRGPVWVAPAMNTAMWDHAATRANLATLAERGVQVIGPGSGPLACGEVGEGRMAEPEAIVSSLERGLAPGTAPASGDDKKPLSGQKVLITAGPTREALDPIRFISNRSTGRMGVSLADEAVRLGAEVTLVHGPMSVAIPSGVRSIAAEDAEAMLRAVQEHFPASRIAIFVAAVANYRAARKAGHKIKGGDRLQLDLVRTPDIAAWAGANRNGHDQLVVGFAAESEDLIAKAKDKLKAKHLDLIFANPIGVEGIGFDADKNTVTMIDTEGRETGSGTMPKSNLAGWMWSRLLERAGLGAKAAGR